MSVRWLVCNVPSRPLCRVVIVSAILWNSQWGLRHKQNRQVEVRGGGVWRQVLARNEAGKERIQRLRRSGLLPKNMHLRGGEQRDLPGKVGRGGEQVSYVPSVRVFRCDWSFVAPRMSRRRSVEGVERPRGGADLLPPRLRRLDLERVLRGWYMEQDRRPLYLYQRRVVSVPAVVCARPLPAPLSGCK